MENNRFLLNYIFPKKSKDKLVPTKPLLRVFFCTSFVRSKGDKDKQKIVLQIFPCSKEVLGTRGSGKKESLFRRLNSNEKQKKCKSRERFQAKNLPNFFAKLSSLEL
jgi:hypothetical protein